MTGWILDETLHQRHLMVHQQFFEEWMRRQVEDLQEQLKLESRAMKLLLGESANGIRAVTDPKTVTVTSTPAPPKYDWQAKLYMMAASQSPKGREIRGSVTHHIWMDEEKPETVFRAASASTQNATESGLTEHSSRLVAAAVAEFQNSKPRLKRSGETLLDLWRMKTRLENPDPTLPPSPTSTASPDESR